MDSGRARAILQMVQDRQDASVQPDERGELVSQGFLVSVDASTRDGWTASVAGLAALRDRVREMSRVALATPGPVAPPELQQMVASLEELTRQKTNLETLVWNAPTQEYFLPTLAGRNVLADLTTWQRRLEGRTFPDFLREMYDYRAALFQAVSRASAIQGGLLWDEETRDAEETPMELSFTNVDFRLAAMILATRAINPSLLVSALARSAYEPAEALAGFEDALTGMAARGYKDGIHIEAAASLLAAGPMARETMVERFSVAMSHLAGTFDPAFAPAAMIAANPLEPLEAIDVFRDCIAVVTRSSFYDLTLEIEELALILSYGVAPMGLGYLAANLPAAPAVQRVPPTAPPVSPLATSWY